MGERIRSYISQSFSVRLDQLEWLEGLAKIVSSRVGKKVGMSEVLRLLIDDYIQRSQPTDELTEDIQPHDEHL